MSAELKLCPFCGGNARQESYIVEAFVFCTVCDARVRAYHDAKEDTGDAKSAQVWNTRAPQWMPIDSAPRDGTVLLLTDGGDMFVAYFNVGNRTWDDGDHHDDIQGLTHWHPLPAPPEVKP